MTLQDNARLIHDRIEGLKQPFEHGLFTGQDAAENHFIKGAQSGRLSHAWLFSGPRGCGKATFAFRLARYFVQARANPQALQKAHLDEAANEESPEFRQIANGSHPNILYLTIPYDEKAKKFKTQISVDEVRRTTAFFGSTSANAGWRIAIVDNANDLTISAANALLKILEEPPEKTLFFLIADQPKRLLPTIRSRCQNLTFNELSGGELYEALMNATDELSFDLDDINQHQDIINGSVRRAFHFASQDAVTLLDDFTKLINQPSYDMPMLHQFADQVSARGADEKYLFFTEFLENHLVNKIRQGEGAQATISWADIWDKIHARIKDEESLNIDRKQTVLAMFHDMRFS